MNTADFVITGGQIDGHIVLLASKTLTDAELYTEVTYPDPFARKYRRGLNAVDDRTLWPPETDHTLTAKFDEYVIAFGATYAEAWEALFKMWSPPQPPALTRDQPIV